MGAENSKSSTSRQARDERTRGSPDKKGLLELQKQIYDTKYAELVRSRIQQNIDHENKNRNNIPNSGSSTSNNLYPNLVSSSNNNLRTANDAPNIYRNKTPNNRLDEEYDEISAIQALELQKHMYDAKYAELLNSQLQIQQMIDQENKNRATRNDIPNSKSSTSSNFYPNLPSSSNNNPGTANEAPNIYLNKTTNNQQQTTRFQPSTASSILVQTSPSISQQATVASAPVIPSNMSPSKNLENGQGVYRGAIPKSRVRPNNTNNMKIGVECVTCKNNFGLYIFQCPNGHSSCNNCKFQNRCCGICSKKITDVRNITLETTIADINIKQNKNNEKIKCYNSKDGCCLSFTINEMDNHLKECPYRVMECPMKSLYINCNWKGMINQISSHINEMHPSNCIADVDQEMNLNNISTNQKIIQFVNLGTFNFLIHINVSENDKIIYMTAQLMGTKVSASKWTYEIHVYNKREPRRKFQYIDICHSDSTSLGEIFDKAQCAMINMDYAKTFFNNKCLSYKLYLKKNVYTKRH